MHRRRREIQSRGQTIIFMYESGEPQYKDLKKWGGGGGGGGPDPPFPPPVLCTQVHLLHHPCMHTLKDLMSAEYYLK